MKHFWIVVLVLLMAGCTQSGVHKTYKVDIVVREGSTAEFFMGVDAETEADTESGDAGISPSTALGMQGGTGQITMGDAKAAAESLWNFFNKQETQTVNEIPEPKPQPQPEPTPEPAPDDDHANLDGWDIVAEAKCDGEISVDGIIQPKCQFDVDVSTKMSGKMMLQWSTGDKWQVKDVGHWDLRVSDAAKWWPREPVPHGGGEMKPGTPSEAYAPRGTKPAKVVVLRPRG